MPPLPQHPRSSTPFRFGQIRDASLEKPEPVVFKGPIGADNSGHIRKQVAQHVAVRSSAKLLAAQHKTHDTLM
jgi:hypothetical protein